MNFLDKWNKSKFNVYTSEEKTVLKLISKISDFIAELSKGVDEKTDINGNHNGSWQGVNRPTLSDEGMRGMVEKHITDINDLYGQIDKANIRTPEYYGCKGDGITDDSDNLLRAMNECASNGNILLLQKRYKLSKSIVYEGTTSLTVIGTKGNYSSLLNDDLSISAETFNIFFAEGSTLTLAKLGSVTFFGVGFSSSSKLEGTGIINQSFRNKFIACSFSQMNKAIYNKTPYLNWNGENQYLFNQFTKCEYPIYSDDLSNSDSEFIGNLVHGSCTYGYWGECSGWKFALNHFYNKKASYFKIFNTDITNNYIQECTLTDTTINVGDGFGCLISGNKFELNNDSPRFNPTGLIGLKLANGRGGITFDGNTVHGKSNVSIDNLSFIKLIYTDTKYDNNIYIGSNNIRLCRALFNEFYPYYNINGQLTATSIPTSISSGTLDTSSFCKVVNGNLYAYAKLIGSFTSPSMYRLSALDTPHIAICNVTTSTGTTTRTVFVPVGGWVVIPDYASITSIEIIIQSPVSHGTTPKYSLI